MRVAVTCERRDADLEFLVLVKVSGRRVNGTAGDEKGERKDTGDPYHGLA